MKCSENTAIGSVNQAPVEVLQCTIELPRHKNIDGRDRTFPLSTSPSHVQALRSPAHYESSKDKSDRRCSQPIQSQSDESGVTHLCCRVRACRFFVRAREIAAAVVVWFMQLSSTVCFILRYPYDAQYQRITNKSYAVTVSIA